jgi:hypothetical protein
VAATAGAGKTTLLRYLRQKADTVRYNAVESCGDANWMVQSWNAPCAADTTHSKRHVRHVFVGFATFNQASTTQFDAPTDTTDMIEHRCVWRILFDAGLAPKWNENFRLTFPDAAAALRAKIGTAKGCKPEEVAIVFLIDEATKIINDGARSRLLDKIAGWQQADLENGHPALSIVAGLSLFAVGDQWITTTQRQLAALPLPPLALVPKALATDVKQELGLRSSRAWELLAYISAAGGHPRTLEFIAAALKFPQRGVELPEPGGVKQFMCVWHVFAASMIPGSLGFSVRAQALANEPEFAIHRSLLDARCMRQHPAREFSSNEFPWILLNATPAALFLAGSDIWNEHRRTSPGFPNYEAANAVRELMQTKGKHGIPKAWELGLAGGLYLTAQCVLYARLDQIATLPPSGQQQRQALRGSVLFKDLVPGAIIGCRCDGLQYVVRGEFVDSVEGALTSADFQRPRDASCLHSWSPTQEAVEYVFAAECGGEPVEVGAQHKLRKSACESEVNDWFSKVAAFMKARTGGDKFRVLLCVTGLSATAIESIETRAKNADDPLSRAIIIDTATASQFFERLGVFILVETLKDITEDI